jgi:arylsulfatase A-like enzyme
MINGNWRIIPSYGHSRGYAQYVYQNQAGGFKVGEEIKSVIEHIETFKDTNQFVWMSIGDLHDVADGLFLPIGVEKNIDIANRQKEEIGVTSAKQNYSEQKRIAFIEQAKNVDFMLGFLFRYIEDNYQNDEILVSLFADHGQGYLIPPNGHFIGKERSNIAFMFRGGCVKEGVTSELMSSSDYLPIMCKMAGIELNDSPIDGQVPVQFGGERQREYALTESLHPKDPYYASIFTDDFVVCFQSEGVCTDEGKFKLGDYKIWMLDYENHLIENPEALAHYESIILEHIAPILIYEE